MKCLNYNKLMAWHRELNIFAYMGKQSSLKIHSSTRYFANSLDYLAEFVENQFGEIAGIYMEIQASGKIERKKLTGIYKKSFSARHRKLFHSTTTRIRAWVWMGFKMINWPSRRMSSLCVCIPRRPQELKTQQKPSKNFSSHIVCVLVNLIQSTENCFKVENDLIFLRQRFQSKL